jgi:hypothetical protein
MVSIMFGKKWAIIKESQNVFGIEMVNLLSSTKKMYKPTTMFGKSDPDKKEVNLLI